MWIALAKEFGIQYTDDLDSRYQRRVLEELAASTTAIPGVAGVLDRLTGAGVPVCVASSGRREKMAVTLEVTGLSSYFGGSVFSTTEVDRGKPSPDLLLHAASQMGVAPDRCAVVEDSRPGLLAGMAGGMTVFGYAPSGVTAELVDLPARFFRHVTKLPSLLGF